MQKVQDRVNYIIKNLDVKDEDKCFIEDLAYMAQVQVAGIKTDRDEINKRIKDIDNFINSNSKTVGIAEINKIFGFIKDFDFSIDDGNYYLFVANVKIKSMAFLCRTYSFIKKYERHEENEWQKKLEKAEDDVKNQICKVLEDEESLIKSISEANKQVKELNEYKIIANKIVEKNKEDNEKTEYYKLTKEQAYILNLAFQVKENKLDTSKLDQITELLKIENKVADIKSQKEMANLIWNKSDKSEYRSLRYFIFDNSMREVEFFGIESRFNWLWESEHNVCLYRNVTEKNADTCKFEAKKGMTYMRELMSRIVSHANGTNYEEAISYSRNPIRDIYKYLDLAPKAKPLEIVFTINAKNEQLELKEDYCLNTSDKATFEFIENASTNVVKTYKDNFVKEYSFYEYLKLSEDDYSQTKYCIEFCKKNAIIPSSSGRRLKKLSDYLHTWGIYEKFMFSFISENDDEVITSIDYFADKEKTVYELNFADILVVLYKIYYIEDEQCDYLEKLKGRIQQKYKDQIEEQLKKLEIKKEIELEGGVTIKIILPDDKNETILTNVRKKIKEIPEKIAGIIIDKIIRENENSDMATKVISDIKKGIEKDKDRYQYARKENFKLFVGKNGENGPNKILSFWKQLFKEL